MADWYAEYLASARLKGVKESTVRSYEHQIISLRKYGLRLEHISREKLLSILSRIQKQHSPLYYCNFLVIVKSILKAHGKGELADAVPWPRMPDARTRIQNKIISSEDRKRLIDEAPSLFLRLLLSLMDELGGRIGEIAALKIKSVQFDEHSAIVTLTGKTGTRRRRVYSSVPDLRHWLNNHPCRGDPEGPLFATDKNSDRYHHYHTHGLRCAVQRHGLRVLRRKITPHMFRHSRATEDARYFTDREMMLLNGWSSPHTVGVYSHLSMRDVDDKDLVLHGLKAKEEILRPIMQVIRCKNCSEENAPVAVYCVKCGGILASKELGEENEELREQLKQQDERLRKLEAVHTERLTLKNE